MELELIDGNPVVSHVVRFKDRTTINERDADAVRDGAVVVWIVRTVCQPPSYHPVKRDSDERYRFNIQNVQAAAVLHGELRDGALAYLDDPTMTQGRFVFDAPLYDGSDEPAEINTDLVFHEIPADWSGPLPDMPDSAYPPGGTPLDVELLAGDLTDEDDDEGVRSAGSVYGTGGSDTQRLLQKWDEL